ncbi:SdrD B-like domain-containing protein [Lentzea rhizosphaerae]|uniref:SdrD B-like domain-containing protein n=1 Tax=Lentzea rhizosphaerae TaxID=2041025 RepID=A0ABV8BQ40_9PSEU
MKRPLAAALAVLVAAPFAVVTPTANAGPGDGSLNVTVVRDVNGNGTYEAALEVGVQGAAVLVTDPAGKTAAGTTDAQGKVTVGLGAVSGGKYRVQVSPPAGSVLQPAPAGAGLESNTMFVDVSGGKTVNVMTALWNPADYCQANPTLVTGCQRATRKQDGSSNVTGSERSLVTFPFTNRGTGPAPAQIATQGVTGSVYGIAYRKQDKRIFSGAFAKRLTNYGSGNAGGIYVTPAGGGATTLFATVPNAGTTKHDHANNFDGGFANVVGKEALGDIDISEDGSELYVVNLGDKKLYVYDAAVATAGAPKGSYAIPSPCANANDWRPGALGVRDGVVYVGGVCSGETSQNTADMRAVVRTFSGGAFSAPVVNQPLNFKRGTVLWQGTNTDRWLPWKTTYTQPTPTGGLVEHPEPLLTDIGVEAKGDLVLAFRDRFGDQGGKSLSPADGSAGTWDTVSGGDLNRACRQADGSFAWEGTSNCPNNNTAANNGGGEAADVVEYYPGEYYKDANGAPHNETAQGALVVAYGESRMPATVMDPTALNTGGTGWFDRTNGTMAANGFPNAYQISDVNSEGWGKANGLADLEALCDLAPVQIGNRVWFDTDADGVQDGDEPPVPGVKVTATPCAGGASLGTKVTNAKGEYYFGVADGLKPETCYNLTFDRSAVNAGGLPNAPDVASLKWTIKEAGPDRVIDSNVDAEGKTQVTTGKAGTADHTIDAGINAKVVTNSLGDFVWVDTNRNGLQDTGEPAVQGMTVVLKKGDGTQLGSPKLTDAQGKYLFDQLPDGVYEVCFDLSKLPAQYAGYTFTGKDAGDDTKDSDADPADGCTPTTTLGAAKREDLTLDAGLVPPNNKLGDYVWVDTNRNGVQDGDEPGVPNVTVKLDTGKTTTTDANGKYVFDQLPDGTFTVCFDVKNLPAPYQSYLVTRPDAGGDDGKDSDANAEGCAPPTSLGPNKREDLTLDLGIRPPDKLGDTVWKDENKNGLQDPGEPGVPGVTVKLGDKTTTTDENGKYEFPNLPDGTYTVCFDIANLPAAVKDYVPTTPNAGSDDVKDSDADVSTGCTPPTTLNVDKPEDPTLDLGLISPVNRLGDYVWIDVNSDGLQDATDVPVEGVTVKLSTGATTKTDAQGKYLFDNLPDGKYTVCFDIANLPASVKDYKVTKLNAGGDDAKDSDADPATGCVPETTLGVGNRVDLSLDMGLVSPPNKLGDLVWLDSNSNGVQDDGEPGVPNVPVKLSNGASTTTDAQGKYLFDDLPDGKYTVCFGPMPDAVKDYFFTKPNAGSDDTKDSDANVDTGCTPEVELGLGKRENLTVDAGIHAPINLLGDFVWIDANKNGLQDEGEKPVADVTVKLNTGATTKTDQYGIYLFRDLPDGEYTVCFDLKNLPAAVADYTATKPDAGDEAKDSDADPATGCTQPVQLGVDKRKNLTLDLGLVAPPNKIGDFVWSDTNRNGVQDPGEPGVPGVPVKLVDDKGKPVGEPVKTGPDGKYEFPNVPDGTYKVCFEMGALPGQYAGYVATKPNVGDDTKDSDVDPAGGCTPPVKVGVGKRVDQTQDLGLVPPTNRVGDFVWYDNNSNGVQDAGEPGVPDLPVFLQDGSGKPVAQSKTDKDGRYLFTDLPDGAYKVCFNADPQTGLVAGRELTKANAGDDGRDSDADPATGCTPVVKLGKDKRVDLTLDAGLLPRPPAPPLASTGAAVWGLLLAALTMIAGGAFLLLQGRRRRRT